MENNFKSASEIFAKSIKWIQDENSKLIESQKQQLIDVTKMWNIKTDNSFSNSNKSIIDLYNKNMESFTTIMKVVMKPVISYNLSDRESFMKQVEKQIEKANKQIFELSTINQSNYNLILKQFNDLKGSFGSIDQLKNDLEKNIESTKELMETLVSSYYPLVSDDIIVSKEKFDKINEELKSAYDINTSFWSELMNKTNVNEKPTKDSKPNKEKLKIILKKNKKQNITSNMN